MSTVLAMCSAKSVSVRVGPIVGAMDLPVASFRHRPGRCWLHSQPQVSDTVECMNLTAILALGLYLLSVSMVEPPAPATPLPAQPAPAEAQRASQTQREPPPPELPPAEAPQEEACAPLIAQVTEILNGGSVECSEAPDCGCYSGGMGPRSSCGGIANRTTLNRLAPIATRFRASDCYPTSNCAAWQCIPVCEAGQCRNSRRGGGRAGSPPPKR